MRSSILLAASSAILAAASPVLQERKLVVATDVVMTWVTVTVTEGHQRPTMFRPGKVHIKPTTSSIISSVISSSSIIPSTSAVPIIPLTSEVPVVPAPAPEPTTVEPAPAPPAPPAPATSLIEQFVPAPAPAPVKEAAPAAPTDYQSTILYHHNIHRANHSAADLSWGDSYAGYALETAQKCKFEHDLTPGGGGYGQNLAMYATSSDAQAFGASRAGAQASSNFWYNGELNKFPSSDYGKGSPDMGNFHDWGHFSQLVWSSTQQVGCATYLCPAGTMVAGMDAWFTVCNYFPAGNMGGAYGTNVFPPQGQPGVSAA
jgi:hypothetical protein